MDEFGGQKGCTLGICVLLLVFMMLFNKKLRQIDWAAANENTICVKRTKIFILPR